MRREISHGHQGWDVGPLDFILRNLQALLQALAGIALVAYLFRGARSMPRYRLRMQDTATDYLFMQQREEIGLWHRLNGFVHTHPFQVWSVAVAVAIPAVLVAIPAIRRPLATVALDFPKPVCGKLENRKLLLFIHGWYGGSDGTWQQFPGLACHDERLTDVDVIAVNYPTFAARRNLNVAQLADWLNPHLDFGKNRKYQRVVIIAHSMGGLLSREIVILRSLGESQKEIVAMVEVASPHLGANPAGLASALGISQPLTDEMAHGSSFLTTLQTEWQRVRTRPQTQCYTSPQDSVVSEDSAMFQCDGSLAYPQWGHRELVKPVDASDDRYKTPICFVIPFLEPVSTSVARGTRAQPDPGCPLTTPQLHHPYN